MRVKFQTGRKRSFDGLCFPFLYTPHPSFAHPLPQGARVIKVHFKNFDIKKGVYRSQFNHFVVYLLVKKFTISLFLLFGLLGGFHGLGIFLRRGRRLGVCHGFPLFLLIQRGRFPEQEHTNGPKSQHERTHNKGPAGEQRPVDIRRRGIAILRPTVGGLLLIV